MGDKLPYGTKIYDTYSHWSNEKQFKAEIKMYMDMGIDIFDYSNEPDYPVRWIKEVVGDKVPVVADLHDLDSIRRGIIPLEERKMFNYADGLIYVSLPIQKITNELQKVTVPNTVLYSYCNEGIIEYKEEDIPNRKGIIYEGGANSPDDTALNNAFQYRSLYNIIKRLVSMGNETYMFCGNFDAFQTYQHTGAILFPPTDYKEMMEKLIQFKYGILIFNNPEKTENQVNYTLTNKEEEYLQAGLPSLACWCDESMKHVKKHGTGFTFEHIDEVGDMSQLESQYLTIMDNIKIKRKELVMENFIWKIENLYAKLLNVDRKGIPSNIKAINLFEYGEENTRDMLV